MVTSVNEEAMGSIVDAAGLKTRKIVPGLPIKGLLLNEYSVGQNKHQLVCLETSDNQLDINRLFIENFDNDDSFNYYYT